jgi:SAM-dependent methyltransferase
VHPGCCGPATSTAGASLRLGCTPDGLGAVPEGADLGLGCGNPKVVAALRPGERVLDPGSGARFDCLLTAQQVGSTGSVIGADMTAEMIPRARENTVKAEARNVEFRPGEIERLPVRHFDTRDGPSPNRRWDDAGH